MHTLRLTVQFMLSKVAIAWMFALVTINFNRIAVLEFGIAAVLVTTMIGLYPFFGPLQPLFGRFINRYPLFGYRRSPYLILGLLAGSLVFPPLPATLVAIQHGSIIALTVGFLLFFIFGISIALMANTFLDLAAECIPEADRKGVMAGVWTGQTLAIVLWATVFRLMMPEFSFESMQTLYTATPFVVMTIGVLSVAGLEKRLTPAEFDALRRSEIVAETEFRNPVGESMQLLRRNRTAQQFFLFVFLSFFGVFLQDLLQELMGTEVFGLSLGETTVFQQIFNGTVTLGMGLTAAFGATVFGNGGKHTPNEFASTIALPMETRKRMATLGGFGVALTLLLIAATLLTKNLTLLYAVLTVHGFFVGVFTFAAVTMMAEMTVEAQAGKYLGIWSLAQALGLGGAFMLSGVLHGALVQSHWLGNSALGYAVIFTMEAGFMLWCIAALRPASVENLRREAQSASAALQSSVHAVA